jgi:hypothetical protein
MSDENQLVVEGDRMMQVVERSIAPIEERDEEITSSLVDVARRQLRASYQDGLVDGFKQGVAATENVDLRSATTQLLMVVKGDHGDGSDVLGLPELITASEKALSVGG